MRMNQLLKGVFSEHSSNHVVVVRVGALCPDDNAAPVQPVFLGRVLPKQESLVGDVGSRDCRREEEEGKQRLPDLDLAVRGPLEYEVEPDVGEDGPRRRDDEDAEVLDTAHLAARDDAHAYPDDDEEVERRRADDRARAEVASGEVLCWKE